MENNDRNIAYYATKKNDGTFAETGARPENIPYPIADIMFDAAGNALDGTAALAPAQMLPVDETMTVYLHDIIDNHPDAVAVRPIYKNVTYVVTQNPWPDDAGYNPFLEGIAGRKSHHAAHGDVVEFGTRPESIPDLVPGLSFDVLGNVLQPVNMPATAPLKIDQTMTKRIREWVSNNNKEA